MKIAFLTSYNSDLFKKNFEKFIFEKGVNCTCWWNSYATQEQVVFDGTSKLYEFSPNILIMHFEAEWMLGDLAFDILSLASEDRAKKAEEAGKKLENIIKVLIEKFPQTQIVVENFTTRTDPYLGFQDSNISSGISELVNCLNQSLFGLKERNSDRVIIADFSGLISAFGKLNAFDSRFYRLAKNPFARKFYDELFRHYYSFINILSTPRKKCIVVDLDNTLWGGIVGQDGIDKIELGGSGAGEAFVYFQKALLNYYRKGIFLAVCSKNNFEDAIEVIDKHPDMILRKSYFSSLKINWADKATNIREIAKDLNIGIDALVFLDDNPAECELVKQQLPEVEVINLSGDPDNYINQLLGIVSLQTVLITSEDLNRNVMLADDEKRKEYEQSFTNLDDYYKSLEMKAVISINDDSQISRIAQLTQKTNQFNLTTRRYTVEDIKSFIGDGYHKIYTLRLTDKFGDNGIVLVAIVRNIESGSIIDTFLMSCRVIGRQAETVLLNKIIEDARATGVKLIRGEFIPTKKNAPAKNFYVDHGFSNTSGNEWIADINVTLKNHFVQIITES